MRNKKIKYKQPCLNVIPEGPKKNRQIGSCRIAGIIVFRKLTDFASNCQDSGDENIKMFNLMA